MTNTLNIKVNRLLIAIAITFLVADTYPHPHLSPGVVETMGSRVQIAVSDLIQE